MSKVLYAAILFRKYTRALTFENLSQESKIRQSLQTVGVLDSAYWISWHLFHGFTSLLTALLITLIGMYPPPHMKRMYPPPLQVYLLRS